MVKITDKMNEKYIQHEVVEATQQTAAFRNECRREDKLKTKKRGGQQASSFAPVNKRVARRAPVDGC